MNASLNDFVIGHVPADMERLIGSLALSMQQDTPRTQRTRGAGPTGFPDRATREFSFTLPTTFPPCATMMDAVEQLFTIPAACPKGGTLKIQEQGRRITFAAAWLQGAVSAQNLGLTNLFGFPFIATDPTLRNMVVDAAGHTLLDGAGNELEY